MGGPGVAASGCRVAAIRRAQLTSSRRYAGAMDAVLGPRCVLGQSGVDDEVGQQGLDLGLLSVEDEHPPAEQIGCSTPTQARCPPPADDHHGREPRWVGECDQRR